MNKIPNWYCKTEGLSVEQIDEALLFAVEHGACEVGFIRSPDKKYFGVDEDGDVVGLF